MRRRQFFIILVILIIGFLVIESTSQPLIPFNPFNIVDDPVIAEQAEALVLRIYPSFYLMVQSGMGPFVQNIPVSIIESYYQYPQLSLYVNGFYQIVTPDNLPDIFGAISHTWVNEHTLPGELSIAANQMSYLLERIRRKYYYKFCNVYVETDVVELYTI